MCGTVHTTDNKNHMPLQEGKKAPAFTLPDQNNTPHSLKDYIGKWVLLYFYPRDNTPGCTTEACTIRDSFSEFGKYNSVVLGVSTDSVASHKKFEQKYGLPFTLLADEDKKVVRAYEVWGKKSFMGKVFAGTHRMSYLINPHGVIVHVYQKVKPADHASEVLHDIQANS